MIDVLGLLCAAVIGLFRSSTRREAEIMVLRYQLNVLRRGSPKRIALSNVDRLLFVWLSRLVPTTLDALMVVGVPAQNSKSVEKNIDLRRRHTVVGMMTIFLPSFPLSLLKTPKSREKARDFCVAAIPSWA